MDARWLRGLLAVQMFLIRFSFFTATFVFSDSLPDSRASTNAPPLAHIDENVPPAERSQEWLLRDIKNSHIDENVPPAEHFQEWLLRDIKIFAARTERQQAEVELELLRDAPTQAGTAYPKFYIWIRLRAADGTLTEGAARVSAIERKHFEVTAYLTKSEILKNPERLSSIFPKEVALKIKKKAGLLINETQ